MSASDEYENLSPAELIERIRRLEAERERGADHAARVELAVSQEEILVQNQQLRDMQTALEASRDRYAELYDFAPTAYATLDAQGLIVEINLTGAELLGLGRQYLIGQPLRAFMGPAERTAFSDHLRRCRQSGRDVSTSVDMVARDGRAFPAQLTTHSIPPVGPDDEQQYRSAITDLTELRRAEQERQHALLRESAARTAAETKDRLIAMVSHELRTPLAAVLLWAKILQLKPATGADHARALEIIVRSAESQRQLIDDLLDISRITSGKLRLELKRTHVATIVSRAVDSLLPVARAKDLSLLADSDADLYVHADPDRLQQVLWNLVSNAVKFTPPGGQVSVSARRFGNELDMRVVDSGDGIDAELLPHVFEPFRQAESVVTTRAHGGLGLGLAITRELIERHGGSIHARSEGRGSGSTFVVRLPLLLEAGTALLAPGAVAGAGQAEGKGNGGGGGGGEMLAGLNVLVVEDELATRSALERVIGDAGAEVIAVESAQAAIDVFQRRPPDLLVGDIGMPGVDGYQMMRHLRALEQSGARPPVAALALTAFASKADHARAQEAGFDIHLGKPVQPAELLSALQQLAGARRRLRASQPSSDG